jgi:DNA-directed RNA polymerase subunit alpha
MDLKKKGFQLPENVYFDSESLTDTYGKLYAEAFERGYGTTIGNALRRVLLSSIEGAAVTSIRVPGVLHEFTTIKGVKDDVVDVVLNVKQLRFRLHSDEPKVATISVKGPADVTGKDISGDGIEVLTPDQHIATVGKGMDFNMELTVAKGKGYVPAEENKSEDQPIDTISIDAIFTPIKKVNFWVEGARVGRSTNYDKLVMEICADGSVTPREAVEQAAGILTEHLNIFSFNGASVSEDEAEPAGAAEADDDEGDEGSENPGMMTDDIFSGEPAEVNEYLLKTVDELELSVRAYNCLKNANIRTLADLVQKTEQEMLRTKNFGRKSLNEIKEIIHSMGLRFNMRVDTDELQKLAAAKRMNNAT